MGYRIKFRFLTIDKHSNCCFYFLSCTLCINYLDLLKYKSWFPFRICLHTQSQQQEFLSPLHAVSEISFILQTHSILHDIFENLLCLTPKCYFYTCMYFRYKLTSIARLFLFSDIKVTFSESCTLKIINFNLLLHTKQSRWPVWKEHYIWLYFSVKKLKKLVSKGYSKAPVLKK